jgi:hypothetical protein
MNHILTFDQLNEAAARPVSLWRTTDIQWLLDLLDDKKVGGRPYVSMSRSRMSGADEQAGSDGYDYGNVTVELDAAAVYAQGAVDVVYTPEWFDEHPDVAKYVLGWKAAPTQEDKDEYDADFKMPGGRGWEKYVRGFAPEQEVLLKQLAYKKGLVKSITVWPDEDRDEGDELKIERAERLTGLAAIRKDEE